MPRTPAPDIRRNFPSKGEKVGPAWQYLWDRLGSYQLGGQHHFILCSTLVEVAPQLGLVDVTLANLLRMAADKGLIERKYKVVRGHRVVAYRRPLVKAVEPTT